MRSVNPFLFRHVIRGTLVAAVLWWPMVGAIPARAEDGYRLVMVEQAGCHWCARWMAEIGPIYPKTPEGKAVPLRHVDLHEPFPEDLVVSGPVIFTPTFLLTENGTEKARIEGYSGEELFWWMIARLFETEGVSTAATQ